MPDRNVLLEALDGKSAMLFLVAGGLTVVFAGLLGVEAFTEQTAPEDVFGPAGFAVAYLGLLGLYPTLAEQTPRLARAGAVFAAIGAVGAGVVSLGSLGAALSVLPADPGPVAIVFILGLGVGMVPGYVTFGVASLLAGLHSRRLGVLLLAPPAIFVVMLSGILPSVVDVTLSNFILSSGQAIAHLAIGVVLMAEGTQAGRPTATADAVP